MTDTIYGKIFTLELLHKYFADGVCNDFTITPTMQTKIVLGGNKIIAKQYGNKLYAGLQVDIHGDPTQLPAAGTQLTFLLQLNTVLFSNYTNLPPSFPAGKLYYFTNRNSNAKNGKNFLTMPVGYDSTRAYTPGDLASDGAGAIFQNVLGCTNVAPAGNSNWVQAGADQYVSETDAVQWMPSLSVYNFLAPQTVAAVDVWGYNNASNDYTNHVLSKTTAFAKPVSGFTLNLSSLPAGKYKLTVNGTTQWIYINAELTTMQAFAVVDIFIEDTLAPTYLLLDGGNPLPSPLYSIGFLNRSTIWKYILKAGSTGTIADADGVYQFAAPAANTIFSLTPIPLSQQALNFTLTFNMQNYSPIPCASPQRLVNYKPAADIYSCSEIFLNY